MSWAGRRICRRCSKRLVCSAAAVYRHDLFGVGVIVFGAAYGCENDIAAFWGIAGGLDDECFVFSGAIVGGLLAGAPSWEVWV